MSDESRRLAHARAEDRAREAAVPAPSPQPRVPGHEQEILSKHLGTVLPQTFSVAEEAM